MAARSLCLLVAFVGAGLAAHPAAAVPYDTTRVLERNGNECLGYADCLTIESPRVGIRVNGSRTITVACPAHFPHLVGWDTEQHEHIRVLALQGLPQTKPIPHAATKRDALTVTAINNADARGHMRLYIGCSHTPWAGTPLMSSRQGLPSKLLRKGAQP